MLPAPRSWNSLLISVADLSIFSCQPFMTTLLSLLSREIITLSLPYSSDSLVIVSGFLIPMVPIINLSISRFSNSSAYSMLLMPPPSWMGTLTSSSTFLMVSMFVVLSSAPSRSITWTTSAPKSSHFPATFSGFSIITCSVPGSPCTNCTHFPFLMSTAGIISILLSWNDILIPF